MRWSSLICLNRLGLNSTLPKRHIYLVARYISLSRDVCVYKCNLTETLLGSTPHSFRYLSDQSAVRCSIRRNKPAPQAKRVTYRKTKGAFLWHDPHQDQWPEITRIMVDQMNRRILVQSGFIVHLIYHVPDHPKGTHPKSVDLDCLKQDIAKSDLCLQGCVGCPSSWEDFDKFVQSYNSTLSSILDRHAPQKSKVVGSRPQVPCYNQEFGVFLQVPESFVFLVTWD